MTKQTNFRQEAINILSKLSELEEVDIKNLIEIPKEKSLGDYAFPCFVLAKTQKKNPAEIASELVKKICEIKTTKKYFSKIVSQGPYVNFYSDSSLLSSQTLGKILKDKKDYGRSSIGKKSKVMIEYCQVNTHKAFHVGHLRGTLTGAALIRLLNFAGYDVTSANYQGDIGAHVAKSLWYLTKHYKGEYPKKDRGIWLGQIYQKANSLLESEAKKKPIYEKEISEVLQKLEAKDKSLVELWTKTRQWSLDDFEVIYKKLGVSFDNYFFESQMEKPGKEIVQSLKKQGLVQESDGALIVNLEKYNLAVCIVLKSDGTALYSTKDLALAKVKFEKFKIKKSVYVVGSEQKFYFQQIFKILELMGFAQAKDCYHVPYGLVNLEGGKISSREGELLLGDELIERVKSTAADEVKKRHEDWDEKLTNKTADSIALAGIKFDMISIDTNKPIIFSIKKALDFEGESGPYIQYAHARICSILRNYNSKTPDYVDMTMLDKVEEKKIVSMLAQFCLVIEDSAQNYRLTTLCRYLLDLSQAFNEYYHKYQILKEEEKVRDARIVLITSIKQVLENGLTILGIDAPEKM